MSAPPPSQPPPRVLVVDDTPANLDVLIDLLDGEGIEVMIATGGAQALDVVVSHRPDLMLLDVRMPGMDGFETYRRLRDLPGMGTLPVIFVTAEGDVEMVSKGAAMGGIDYVTKPFQADTLLALIRSRLQHDSANGQAPIA